MDHIYYLYPEDRELGDLLSGCKSMIIYGWNNDGQPSPEIKVGDNIYFVNQDDLDTVKAKGRTVNLISAGKFSCREELVDLLLRYQHKLQLDIVQLKKWVQKKYILLIEVDNVHPVNPFSLSSFYPLQGEQDIARGIHPVQMILQA
jgi:hypothetical protein